MARLKKFEKQYLILTGEPVTILETGVKDNPLGTVLVRRALVTQEGKSAVDTFFPEELQTRDEARAQFMKNLEEQREMAAGPQSRETATEPIKIN